MPSASVISDVTLRNNDAAKGYRELAAASIEDHGGRYVVRGGEIAALEGDWRPQMLAIAEFSSRVLAEAWYRSADTAWRLLTATTRSIETSFWWTGFRDAAALKLEPAPVSFTSRATPAEYAARAIAWASPATARP